MAATINDIPGGNAAVAAKGTLKKHVPGNQYEKWCRVTADVSYPTGGYALTPGTFGFAVQINRLFIANQWPGIVTTGNIWFWNTVTQKLMLIVAATGVELANATDVHDAFCDVVAAGQ